MAFRRTPATVRLVASLCWLGLVFSTGNSLAQSQPADAGGSSEEERQQREIADRFLEVLERSPRRGVALEKVYAYHVESGTLDTFVDSLQKRVRDRPEDGVGWMLLGLFEAQRGRDEEAATAFQHAEASRSEDALASQYLGQSLLQAGREGPAVAAFERAMERGPERGDLLEICQQLGRVHQRAGRTDQALAVWGRLEKLFPDDPRVLEQMAAALASEGLNQQALDKYERLMAIVSDDYRRATFRIEAAELKNLLGRRSEGIADLEKLLGDLNPEGWLFRDVRRRIEDVYLRTGDQDGLVEYYERWLKGHPDDVDAIVRLARFLASADRLPEAMQWLQTGLERAPSRTDLRRELITQLAAERRYAEALQQYALLSAAEPSNADVLRDWGRLLMRDDSRPDGSRRTEASAIWKRILQGRESDAVTTAQVADLYRQAGMDSEALALYEKAVELAPDDPQYREYLGEYLLILKRRERALEVWREIAAGPRRTPVNLARLAELLHRSGENEQALRAMDEAAGLAQKDFVLQLNAARMHADCGQYGRALRYVDAAASFAADEEEHERVLGERIELLAAGDSLDEAIQALQQKLDGATTVDSEQWHVLARYFEANHSLIQAGDAVQKALAAEPNSLPFLTTAARIAQSSGNLSFAAELCRRLADSDRRARGEHLMRLAQLEAERGNVQQALAAANELVAFAPGKSENHEFLAQLCFRLNRPEEGLRALRKAVRINPGEPYLLMSLAAALADRGEFDEALQIYWHAFDACTELDDQTQLTLKLTDLYAQQGRFDDLVQQLGMRRRGEARYRPLTICLAQAHFSIGDLTTARAELEQLLRIDARDTLLLQQLSKVCEQAGRLDDAIGYQRRLAVVAPSEDVEARLAVLLEAAGEVDEATAIRVRLIQREKDLAQLLIGLDSMLVQGQVRIVRESIESRLATQPNNWELLYRLGVALQLEREYDEAARRFREVLQLTLPFDTPSIIRQAQGKRGWKGPAGAQSAFLAPPASPLMVIRATEDVLRTVGLEGDLPVSPMRPVLQLSRPTHWWPEDFGQGRLGALGWLLAQAREEGRQEKLAQEFSRGLDPSNKSPDALYDSLYLQGLMLDGPGTYRAAHQLARRGTPYEQAFYLSAVTLKSAVDDSVTPLTDEEIELMVQCFHAVNQPGGEVAIDAVWGLIPDFLSAPGQTVLSSRAEGPVCLLRLLTDQMLLAEHSEQARELLEQQAREAQSVAQIERVVLTLLDEQARKQLSPLSPESRRTLYGEQSRRPNELLRDLVPRWRMAALAELAPQRPMGNQAVITRWIRAAGAEGDFDQAIAVFDAVADVAIRRAVNRPAQSTAGRGPQSVGVGLNAFSALSLRASTRYLPASSMTVAPLMGSDFGAVLDQTFETARQQGATQLLEAHLQQRMANAPPDERLFRLLVRGYVEWWNESYFTAANTLAEACELSPGDPSLRIMTADLFAILGRPEEGLRVLGEARPTDPSLQIAYDVSVLKLAGQMGDVERTKTAAGQLVQARLDQRTAIEVSQLLQAVGLRAEASAVSQRVVRPPARIPPMASDLENRLNEAVKKGETELAAELALRLLQRQSSSPSVESVLNIQPARNVSVRPTSSRVVASTEEAARKRAITILNRTGRLTDIVARLEEQLEQSPRSARTYHQLVELYRAQFRWKEIVPLLDRAVESLPDDLALRMQRAVQLESEGQVQRAGEEYLLLLERAPNLFMKAMPRLQTVLLTGTLPQKLTEQLRRADLKQGYQPQYAFLFAEQLLRRSETMEAGVVLLNRLCQASPQYRPSVEAIVRRYSIWKVPGSRELAEQLLVPSVAQAAVDPWSGLRTGFDERTPGSTANWSAMVRDLSQTGELAPLVEAIQRRLAEAPGWQGGRVLLAVIQLSTHPQEGLASFRRLFPDDAALDTVPPEVCLKLSEELKDHSAARPTVVKLLEQAVAGAVGQPIVQVGTLSTGLQAMATLRDLQEYGAAVEVAFTALDTALKAEQGSTRFDSSSTEAALVVDSLLPIVDELRKQGRRPEAARLLRRMVSHPHWSHVAGMRITVQPSGRVQTSPGVVRSVGRSAQQSHLLPDQVRIRLKELLKSEDEEDRRTIVEALLASKASARTDAPVFDLHLRSEDRLELSTKLISCPIFDTLLPPLRHDDIAPLVTERLRELVDVFPEDVSVAIVNAVWMLTSRDAEIGQQRPSVDHLVELIATSTLEQPAAERMKPPKEQGDLRQWLSVWPVARECLPKPELRQQGVVIGRRALEAASLAGDTHMLRAMLQEWGALLSTNETSDLAEEVLSQLLDAAHADQLSRPLTAATPTEGRRVAEPANWDEYRLYMQIADTAAARRLEAVSFRAVRLALQGGMPLLAVPVQRVTTVNALMVVNGRQVLVPINRSTSVISSPGAGLALSVRGRGTPIFDEVPKGLAAIANEWQAQGFPPESVYELLLSLVFPEGRPDRIELFLGTIERRDGTSVVALLLAKSAAEAGKLDELSSHLRQREDKPENSTAAPLLREAVAKFAGQASPDRPSE